MTSLGTSEHDQAEGGGASPPVEGARWRSFRRHLSLDGLERFWLQPVDAAPFVIARTFYGIVVAAWAISLIPDFDLVFGADGLNRDPYFVQWELFSLFRFIQHPVALAIGLGGLVVAGLAISLYHNLLQWGVIDESLSPCTGGVSCSERQIAWGGFLTIPLMALGAFGAIGFSLIAQARTDARGRAKRSTT